ncbi:MAG: hypothetical protein K8R48_08605 [Alphaproteobacteria bacterium]|nr:hypothetical protein [Alphaproteobacteria bacterium]
MGAKASDREAAEIGRKLKLIIDYVRDCQTRAMKGEIMDLQGLDDKVIAICDAIAELPEEEGQPLESQMSVLIESLEVLVRTMREQQDVFVDTGAG